MYKLVFRLQSQSLKCLLIFFMYKINNKGPSTEPCGTPLNTFLQLEYFPLILKVLSGQIYPYILFANSNLQDEKIIPVEKQNSNSPPGVVSASSNNSL